MSKVDAVILAGAPNRGELQEVSQEEWEALIPIHGKPMLYYVLEALQKSERIENLIVVGPLVLQGYLPPNVRLIEGGSSLAENVLLGVNAVDRNGKVCLVTADIPLIRPEVIDDFLDRCSELEGDIFYPIVSKEASEQAYPETVRTYFTLKEGTFTGGNMLLAEVETILNSKWILDDLVFQRKKPWKIVRHLGFYFILKFLFKRLSLGQIEQRASELFGYKGVLIISPYPELSTDVDKPSDLTLAEQLLTVVQNKEA